MLDVESRVFGRPCYSIRSVDQITEIRDPQFFEQFSRWINAESIGFCSVKIPHGNNITVDNFIRHGFQFIETSVHPYLKTIPDEVASRTSLITDIDEDTCVQVEQGACRCFNSERFHTDPHFDIESAGLRYKEFIRISYTSSDQTLGVLKSPDGKVIGFTTWKLFGDMAVLFLIGVMPDFQNKGYGKDLWLETFAAMKRQGAKSVKTTVSMNNMVSVNFHTKVGFRLIDPEIVLHYHALQS